MTSCSFSSSSFSPEDTTTVSDANETYQYNNNDIYSYEAKRAGSTYDRMLMMRKCLGIINKSNNNNDDVNSAACSISSSSCVDTMSSDGLLSSNTCNSSKDGNTQPNTELETSDLEAGHNSSPKQIDDRLPATTVLPKAKPTAKLKRRSSSDASSGGTSGNPKQASSTISSNTDTAEMSKADQKRQVRIVDGAAGKEDESAENSDNKTDENDDEDDELDDLEEEPLEGTGTGDGDIIDSKTRADNQFSRYVSLFDYNKMRLAFERYEEPEDKLTYNIPVGHLPKEGVIIGNMNIFCDVHVKEYTVMLCDEMIHAFLIDPERFRAIANKTKCEIEVTRRILNRKMGRYRWLKYLVVVIRGPCFSAIDQCDKLMSLMYPPYKERKLYGQQACVSMFLKEDSPDNSDLYFNFQRTGPCLHSFGELDLVSPFCKTAKRPMEYTPWKSVNRRQIGGLLEPRNAVTEQILNHVYLNRGSHRTKPMDHDMKWAKAAERGKQMDNEIRNQIIRARNKRNKNIIPLQATRRYVED